LETGGKARGAKTSVDMDFQGKRRPPVQLEASMDSIGDLEGPASERDSAATDRAFEDYNSKETRRAKYGVPISERMWTSFPFPKKKISNISLFIWFMSPSPRMQF